MFIGHTKEGGAPQPLAEHLQQAAEKASAFACPPFKETAYWLGLLHDLGKYNPAFQTYVEQGGAKGSVPHSLWGAAYMALGGKKEEALCILGHHSGLGNASNWQPNKEMASPEKRSLLAAMDNHFSEELSLSIKDLKTSASSLQTLPPTQKEAALRMLFSCLVDADRLDTEEFCAPQKASARPSSSLDCPAYLNLLEENLRSFSDAASPLNGLRRSAREKALQKAGPPPGFFSLSLPTGLGKTLTSVHWALEHARIHNLRRLIIVLPFTNIIDQSAKTLKDIFGEEVVLEHHSALQEPDDNFERETPSLAKDNWDAPIIITTTVQFFESLFSNRPSQCRKLHNIAEAVVIFDEVQSLPKSLALATTDMLQDFSTLWNTSFLFCTATQPAFEKREGFEGIPSIIPLIDRADEFFKEVQRVEYRLPPELQHCSGDTLVKHLQGGRGSCLLVVNTKDTAQNLVQALAGGRFQKVFHLSTNMYPAHRKHIISKIKSALGSNEEICLVSTQLIEAGVDLDFACAYREMAPLSSIIQTAGRCNREGKMAQRGQVFIFTLKDAPCPSGIYQDEKNFTADYIKLHPLCLTKADGFTKYYERVIDLFTDKAAQQKITQFRKQLMFEDTAAAYGLIDSPTEAVFISDPNNEANQECLGRIRAKVRKGAPLSRKDFTDIQQFSVSVYPNFLQKAAGHYEILGGCFYIWTGHYSPNFGIVLEGSVNENIL